MHDVIFHIHEQHTLLHCCAFTSYNLTKLMVTKIIRSIKNKSSIVLQYFSLKIRKIYFVLAPEDEYFVIKLIV